MKITNNKITALSILILMLITALSCTPDLNVENLNDPDTERLLSSADIEKLIAGLHSHVFWISHLRAPNASLSCMADELTSSWPCCGRTLSSEPRQGWVNAPDYSYRSIGANVWDDAYTGITSAVGALKRSDDVQIIAYAKFLIGYFHAKIAQFYDKAFIIDETTDLEQPMGPVDYQTLMTYALGRLTEAREICTAEDFQIPENWMPGSRWASDDMAELINSLQAYFMATVSRSQAERDEADWARIKNLIETGIGQSWEFFTDGFTGLWSQFYTYGQLAGWLRVDYQTIGPADTSGNWNAWLASPVENRDEFIIYTPDLRITSGLPQFDDNDNLFYDHRGTKIHYRGNAPHPAVRGTYHLSMYGWSEFDWYYNIGQSAAGMLPMLAVQSLDYILAEANLRLGDKQAAADLINKYRISEGGLPAVNADMPTGTPQDQRAIFGETFWSVFTYEKGIQVFGYDPWQAWMDKRGWGQLVSGTLLHFPIPARELELLGMPNYTLGGVGNPGGAP